MAEHKGYQKITPGLLIEMEEHFMLDYRMNLGDIAAHYDVSPDSLRRFAANGRWCAKREAFLQQKSQEIRDSIASELGTDNNASVEREMIRRLLNKYRHELMLQSLDRAIGAHLEGGVNEDTGVFIPPAVDSIAKVGPILIKRVEHELRKQGHAEFTQNNRAKPSEDSGNPPVDDGQVSDALSKLEVEPGGTSEGDSSPSA